MALSITRLSGGTTPADGSDPRTYPAIWNATATALEAVATDLDTLELSSLDGVTLSSPVDGNLLTYNGSAWVNAVPAVPAGSVLQVVSTTKTDTFSASTAGYNFIALTGLAATITPAATSSTIFVSVTVSGASSVSSGSGAAHYRVLRGATPVGVANTAGSRPSLTAGTYGRAAGAGTVNVSSNFVDSPSSTSATVYSVQLYNFSSGTETLYCNRSDTDSDAANHVRTISTITLMEVAG